MIEFFLYLNFKNSWRGIPRFEREKTKKEKFFEIGCLSDRSLAEIFWPINERPKSGSSGAGRSFDNTKSIKIIKFK